jgi:hypothetical protein
VAFQGERRTLFEPRLLGEFGRLLEKPRLAWITRARGSLFSPLFWRDKKAGQKGEPLHGRAKIPRLFLERPLKARLAQLFSTNSTKHLPIIMVTTKTLFDFKSCGQPFALFSC